MGREYTADHHHQPVISTIRHQPVVSTISHQPVTSTTRHRPVSATPAVLPPAVLHQDKPAAPPPESIGAPDLW